MSDLSHTIKLIMDYISKKKTTRDINCNSINNSQKDFIITIKKDLFFKNHLSKSMDQVYKNNKLGDLYTSYCKDNFTKNNLLLYK
jgi:hypothetical protein